MTALVARAPLLWLLLTAAACGSDETVAIEIRLAFTGDGCHACPPEAIGLPDGGRVTYYVFDAEQPATVYDHRCVAFGPGEHTVANLPAILGDSGEPPMDDLPERRALALELAVSFPGYPFGCDRWTPERPAQPLLVGTSAPFTLEGRHEAVALPLRCADLPLSCE